MADTRMICRYCKGHCLDGQTLAGAGSCWPELQSGEAVGVLRLLLVYVLTRTARVHRLVPGASLVGMVNQWKVGLDPLPQPFLQVRGDLEEGRA